MRKQVGAPPSDPLDATPKSYTDRLRRGSYPPASGYGSLNPDILSTGTGNALVQNKVTFHPCPVMPGSYASLMVLPSTLQSGAGIGLSYLLGVYPDDGTGGWPDTSAGPTVSTSSLDLTSGGGSVGNNHFAAFASNWQPTDYRLWWLAFLYTYTTGPTTPAVLACVSNAVYQISPAAASIPLSTRIRGIGLTGQTALPTTAITPATSGINFEGGNGVTAIGLRRA